MSQPTRSDLIQRLIGPQIPRLWCPPITHYTETGAIDAARMAAHWRTLRPHMGGLLAPGSTGDGWEMTPAEVEALLTTSLDLCANTEMRLLIGILHTEAAAMVSAMLHTVEMLKARTGEPDTLTALTRANVCGFAVCPPRGADLTQDQIRAGLEAVLDSGAPVALYQLPQITQNEMSPELVADLAARYENLILFKDTSGADRVPLSDGGQSGVIMVRGAEGEYAQWLRESGGPYHGWLLSTANSFPAELSRVVALLEIGHNEERAQKLSNELPRTVYLDHGQKLSEKLSSVFYAMAKLVSPLPHGNRYANANKALDHWMAYGPAAPDMPPPMLHAGVRLPADTIAQTGKILEEAGLMPRAGYLFGTAMMSNRFRTGNNFDKYAEDHGGWGYDNGWSFEGEYFAASYLGEEFQKPPDGEYSRLQMLRQGPTPHRTLIIHVDGKNIFKIWEGMVETAADFDAMMEFVKAYNENFRKR